MDYMDNIKFIIENKDRNDDIEVGEYFKLFNKKIWNNFQQSISKQKIYIKPKLFQDLYKRFISLIYRYTHNFSKIKGYIVCAYLSCIFDLPNVTLTRSEFNIKKDTPFKTRSKNKSF